MTCKSEDEEFKIFKDYNDCMISMHEKQSKRYNRVLTIIEKLKGKPFVEELENILKESEADGTFNFVRETDGEYEEEGCELIKGMWVNQYSNGGFTGDSFAGYCYIELKPNRYLKFHYSM